MESLEVRQPTLARPSIVKRIWRASVAGYFGGEQIALGGTSFGEPEGKPEQEAAAGITRQEAWTNLVLALIGGMVCLLPNIMGQCGYLLSPPLLLLSALVIIRMGGLICQACELVEESTNARPGSLNSYEELARAVNMYKVVLVTKNTVMIACIMLSQTFLTGALVGLIPVKKVSKPLLRWSVIMPMFCVMALLKDLTQLSKFASLGMMGLAVELLGLLIGCLLGSFMEHDPPKSYSMMPPEGHLSSMVGITLSGPSPPKSASPVVTKKRKISLPRTSLPTTPTEGQPASRKRRWGSSSGKKKTSLPISTDSLKDLIPGVQVQSTPALEAVMDIGNDDNEEEEEEPEEKKAVQTLDQEKEDAPTVTTPEVKEEGKRRKDRIVKVEEKKTIKLQRKPVVMEPEEETAKMEIEEDPLEQRLEGNPHPRRTSLPVQEATSPAPAAERSPSPARNPQNEVLHVKNLVRPFTLNQLKDLLGKHGTLVEGGFWIDKIKSHCYVVYSDVEEAAACRRALHGIKWPVTSPKILDVDFADQDEMARDTDGVLGTKKEKERDIKAEKIPKKEQPEEKPMEVEEEEEDDQKNPGNLLDNLFRKTKTTPCLYWLPLTDEQIATREREREERRKARQEERDKEEEERKERQQQREKEREIAREKEKRERETEKPRSRSPRNRRRERSRSRSRGPRRR